MPVTINGNGTITGVSVGGLPDGIVDTDMIAANAVSSAKLASGAVSSAKLASGAGGKILQVKSSTKTNTASFTTQNTFFDINGLSVSITPLTSSSHMLLVSHVTIGGYNNTYIAFRFVRDSTAIGLSTSATGSQTPCTFAGALPNTNNAYHQLYNTGGVFLDDRPDGTSAITYKLQTNLTAGSSLYINRSYQSDNNTYHMYGTSSITVYEVGT